MLCLAVEKLPEGPAWQYEVKLDGYRAIGVRTRAGRRCYWSRTGTRAIVGAPLRGKVRRHQREYTKFPARAHDIRERWGVALKYRSDISKPTEERPLNRLSLKTIFAA